MSTFDPTTLEQTVVEEANAVKMDPVPEGEYDNAYIDSYKINTVKTDDGPVPQLNVMWRIDNEDLAKKLERDQVLVKQTIWLDVTSEGALATGANKNVQLGRLREALKQNKPGKSWSFSMIEGAGPCRIFVGQRPDRNDSEIIYNDVKKVTGAK